MKADVKCTELYQGRITFIVSNVSLKPGDTLTIEFNGEVYASEVNKAHTSTESFEVSFPTLSRERSHGEKLLRRAAGDKAYGDYV